MHIAIPKETHPGENRVPITPDHAKKLCKLGAVLIIESGMGTGSGFTTTNTSRLERPFRRIARSCFVQPMCCCGCVNRRWKKLS